MSQGYQMYPPKCYKPPEHLFRLSPRQTLFRSLYESFRGTIFNFAKRTKKKLFLMSPFALLNCYIDESVQKNRSLTI